MTTYTITDMDGKRLGEYHWSPHPPHQEAEDRRAEQWFAEFQAETEAAHGDTLLLRDGLLMAVSEGLTIRSYRTEPRMMRETVAA